MNTVLIVALLEIYALLPGYGDQGCSTSELISDREQIVLAQYGGCCKMWNAYQRIWVVAHYDFNTCSAQNLADRDDVYQPTGTTWWDSVCQR